MTPEIACARLRDGLRVLVERSSLSPRELAEELGRSDRFLGRMLNGKKPLRVEEVFHLLAVLDVRPDTVFFRLFPLAGAVELPLVDRVPLTWEPPGPVITRELDQLARQRSEKPFPTSVALAYRAARLLQAMIERAGSSQRAVAARVGVSTKALGRAVRGEVELKFRLVFAVLEALEADPGRYFMEVLGPDPADVLDRYRWSSLLDQAEAMRRETAERIRAREEQRRRKEEGDGGEKGESGKPEA